MQRHATFSPCRHYRYTLHRVWSEASPLLAVIGLNPSTADETQDDPTVRRCINFARDWGHGGLVMLNAFGYRATDPRDMKACEEPIGEGNNAAILEQAKAAGLVLAAWGVHGTHLDRERQVVEMLTAAGVAIHCLGTTKGGNPKHPLYLAKSTKPIIYAAAKEQAAQA